MSIPPPRTLFRTEAIIARRQRLHGALVIRQSRASATFFYLCVAMFAVTITATFAISLPRTHTIPALVVTSAAQVKLTPPSSGTVQDILVNEGQVVRKGQILVRINTERQDDTTSAEAKAKATAASLERLSQARLTEGEALINSDYLGLVAEAEGIESRSGLLVGQIEDRRTALQTAEGSLELVRSAYSKGYISKRDFDARQFAVLDARASLKELLLRKLDNDSQLDKARRAARSFAARMRSQRSELEVANIEARSRFDQSTATLGFILKAPVDGTVATILVSTGSSVSPGQSILTILPTGTQFEVRLYASSTSLSTLHKGQQVDLRYDAFPYLRFGAQKGIVTWVSDAVILPSEVQEIKLLDPSYRVNVRISGGPALPLRSGMSGTALVVTDQRSLIRWVTGDHH